MCPDKNDKMRKKQAKSEDQIVLGESRDVDLLFAKEAKKIIATGEISHNFHFLINVLIIIGQFIYSILGLVVGVLCIGLGAMLFLNGVTDSTSWTANLLGMESTLTDTGPGAVLFVVGLFIIIFTRYIIKVKS